MFKDQAAGADFSTNLCQDTHVFQPGKGTVTWKIILMTHLVGHFLQPPRLLEKKYISAGKKYAAPQYVHICIYLI